MCRGRLLLLFFLLNFFRVLRALFEVFIANLRSSVTCSRTRGAFDALYFGRLLAPFRSALDRRNPLCAICRFFVDGHRFAAV